MLARHWRSIGAILVLGFCTIAVIARVLADPEGRVSPDSTNYLRLAWDMSQGNWLWRAEAAQGEAVMSYWAVWPPVYPMAIAAVSQVFSVDMFLASKLVSLICFWVCAAAIWRFFGTTGAVMALFMANASTLLIFSFSWSEGPFILALLLLAIAMTRVIETPKVTVTGHLVLPFLLAVLLFEIRYIGIFSVGVLLAAAVLTWRRSRRSALLLALAAAAAAAVFLAHVQINLDRTGFPTGMPRVPAPETHGELIRALLGALAAEIFLPVTSIYRGTLFWFAAALQAGLLAWLVASALKTPKAAVREASGTWASGFLLVGALYVAAIVVIRWRSQFDAFSFRLINPGTLLLFLFAVNAVLRTRRDLTGRVFVALALLGLVSGTWIAREALWRTGDSPGYYDRTQARLARYADLPPDTVLVFGDEHLRYLRPDLHIVEPDFTPFFATAETWEAFRARLRPGLPVVIDAVETEPWREYHPAIKAFLATQEEGALIPVDAEVDARIDALERD